MDKIMPLGQNRTVGEVVPMRDVVRISVEVAAGLRRAMSKNGIRQIADFVNGMAFAGLLLQKNYEKGPESVSFAETFALKVRDYTDLMLDPEYEGHRREMMVHQLGVADQSPTEMLITAGMSAQDTVTTIGHEYGLSAQDVMDLVTTVMALAIAATTPAEKLDDILDGMVKGVVEKTRLWEQMVPSDEEMFGDEDEDY